MNQANEDGELAPLLHFMRTGKRERAQHQPGAPATPAPPGHITPYAHTAIEEECNALAAMPPNSGRNHELLRASTKLHSIAAAGHVTADYVRQRLLQACEQNGLLAEDGARQCNRTISNGEAHVAATGSRNIPPLEDTIQPATVFTPTAASVDYEDDGEEDKQPKTQQEWMAHILDAEDDFWQSRPSLQRIYDTALARMCSPWAVLAHCAARALTLVSPAGYLPPLVGGAGSLNSFFIITAASGGGKSAAEDVARHLIPYTAVERSLGSGEGFVESFFRPEDKDTGEPAGQYESILFLADESDTIGTLGARTGSTLLSVLRTAWAGKTLSFGYRGRTNQIIEAHSYRACLVMAVQPARAGWLLADAAGGTPQRFLWFPSTDPRISLDSWSADIPQPLALPSCHEWSYAFEIPIPDEARDLILSERVKAAQGRMDALDGHALFCREKFAYALTVLDDRVEMSSEDWRLAGIASEVSTRTRSWVQWAVAGAAGEEAAEKGRLRGVEYAEADAAKADHATRQMSRVVRRVLERLEDGPVALRELTRSVSRQQRPYLDRALSTMESDGLIRRIAEPNPRGGRPIVTFELGGEKSA